MLNALKKAASIGKKIFIIVAVYFFVIGLFFHFFNKDKSKISVDYVKQNRESINTVLNNPELNKTKEQKKIISLYRTFICKMMGEACTNNPNDAEANYKQSVIGGLSRLIILPYQNPPASGLYWAFTGLQNAGFIPKTYAAEGMGFAALSPLLNIWKAFRDIAYMILVLVLIAIGFMIMFRMKLNPQTVITVENALPRIVLSLILITFSFAIAGFLIDLMYIMITLGIAALGNRGNLFNVTEMQNKYLNADMLQIPASLFPYKNSLSNVNVPLGITNWNLGGLGSMMSLGQAFVNLLPDYLNQILRSITAIVFFRFIFHPIVIQRINDFFSHISPVGAGATGILTGILDIILFFVGTIGGLAIGYSLLPLIAMILISFTVILLIFRIFFLLFATYLKILLLTVFSPLFMLFEALPGRNAFSYWFKHLLAEILVFPTVVLIMVVTYVIVNTPASAGTLWQPPFLADMNPNAFTILLGFGILFQIPQFISLVKEMLGVKDMPIGLNLGTFFGGATGTAGAGLGMLTQIGSLSLAAGAFGKELNLQKLGSLFQGRIGDIISDKSSRTGGGTTGG